MLILVKYKSQGQVIGGNEMEKIEKLKEKIDIKDMSLNSDICIWGWRDKKETGHEDCLRDCGTIFKKTPYGSIKY